MKTKILLLHPFTPKGTEVVENNVPSYHSQPQVLVMRKLTIY